MAQGCLAKTIKWLLIISNSLVIVIGVVVLGFSIFALTDEEDLATLIDHGSGSDLSLYTSSTASTLLIALSVLTVVIAFLGCCGAKRESKWMLGVHYVILLVLFVGIIMGVTLVCSQSLYVIRKPLKDSMSLYDPQSTIEDKREATESWDHIQQKYGCCGVYGYSDWTEGNGTIFPMVKNATVSQLVPETCCLHFQNPDLSPGSFEGCLADPGDPRYEVFMDGCLETLDDDFSANRRHIAIISGIIILFMFVNLVTLFCFGMCLDHTKRGYQNL